MSPSTRLAVSCIALLALILMSCSALSAPSDAAEKVSESSMIEIRLDGPSILGVGVSSEFVLRLEYDYPERILNYSYKAELVGDNTIGARVTPNNGTSEQGVFDLNITGAGNPGKIKIRINASASEADVTWYAIEEFEFDVVQSVVIYAVLYNSGSIDLDNVSVSLYVNGELKDSQLYAISAEGTAQVIFNWTFSTIPAGLYIIKLVVDDGSGIVEFSEGNNVLVTEIYYSEPGNILRGILSLIIIFFAVILILTILQKRQPTGRGKEGR